jgi:hypothetical protein
MSSIAVFFVLGGATAFATTQLAKNSVGTGQLKRNAVTAAKIKRNAVTSTKIKKGAVTGAKIKLSSLGTVPSASTAGALTGLSRKGLVQLTPTNGATEAAAREAAPETALFAAGAFTLYAKCFSFATTVKAEVFIRTTVNGAVFDGETDDADGAPSFLNTGTPETEREVEWESASTNSASILSAEDNVFVAMAPDGTAIQGIIPIAVRNGTLPEGNGAYGAGSCLFSGSMLTTS